MTFVVLISIDIQRLISIYSPLLFLAWYLFQVNRSLPITNYFFLQKETHRHKHTLTHKHQVLQCSFLYKDWDYIYIYIYIYIYWKWKVEHECRVHNLKAVLEIFIVLSCGIKMAFTWFSFGSISDCANVYVKLS